MLKKVKSAVYAIKSYGLKKCFVRIFSVLISDAYIVSYKKSGKTWLKVILAKVIALKHGSEMKLDTHLMSLFKSTPNIMFSHAGSTKKNNILILDFGKLLKRKKILFLARDPRDQIVSLFHGTTKRTFLYKGNISKFIRDSELGINKLIDFMNYWAKEIDKKEDSLIVTYEDLRKDTNKELKKILDFLKINVDDNIIDEAVNYSSFNNMRKMELAGTFNDFRMLPVNKKDSNSFKTRKGKVGGYKEELSKEDIAYLDKEIKEKLNPIFGY